MSDYPFGLERSNLLGTEAFRNLLGESLKKAKKEVIIFTAYIKVIGIEWLEQQLKNKNVNCTVVSSWKKEDLAQGSSDLECYEICKKNKWKFKILNDLHAKMMLIDGKELFIGSPNLTGKGMYLVPVSNKEMGIKVKATDTDKIIIQNLLDEAILTDDEIYKSLIDWKKNLPEIKKTIYPEFPQLIKDKLKENYKKLWVHNFPWSDIKELLNDPGKNNQDIIHDLELFGVASKDKKEIGKEIKENFLNSKIFNWLISKLKNSENQEIYFGSLSSIIHNSLLDDPKPYRQDVKKLQANLYAYIKYFKPANIIHERPNISEKLKFNQP